LNQRPSQLVWSTNANKKHKNQKTNYNGAITFEQLYDLLPVGDYPAVFAGRHPENINYKYQKTKIKFTREPTTFPTSRDGHRANKKQISKNKLQLNK